jgi:hypothetical protein
MHSISNPTRVNHHSNLSSISEGDELHSEGTTTKPTKRRSIVFKDTAYRIGIASDAQEMFSDGSLRAQGSWDLIKSLSKEKESESLVENSKISIANANPNMPGATYAMIKQLRLTTKQQQCLARSETYKRKYKPLPPLSPVPGLDNISKGPWHLWEWWAGCARLTTIARATAKLIVGPPITRECGWDLSLPHHQISLLHLLDVHKPLVLYGGPTCAPWSQACTTMGAELREAILLLEERTFGFFADCCKKQHREGRYHLYEQPRNSRLLKCRAALDLARVTESSDQLTCMCMHGLCSPSTGGLHMKPSVLRGTVLLTSRTLLWCDKSHSHEQLSGRSPSGGLKTAHAQVYSIPFCKRLCRDIRSFIRGNTAFPLEEDEDPNASFDPYEEESPIRTPLPIPVPVPPKFLEPTAKPIVRKRIPISEEPPEQPEPARSSGDNPLLRQIQDWDEEEKNAPASEKPVLDVSVVPAEQLALPEEAPVEPLAIAKTTKIAEEANIAVQNITNIYKHRISAGVTSTIQAGPRLRMLQELFGTPFGIDIRGAVIAKRPASTNPPEPLVSRHNAPMLKEVFQVREGTLVSNPLAEV